MAEKERYDILAEKLAAKFNVGDYIYGAEVGVRFGETAAWLLSNFPKLKMILVDPYEPYLDVEYQFTTREQADVLSKALENVSAYEHRITWKIKPSLDASQEIKDGALDFVFIDAEHTFIQVMQDMILWHPKLQKNGILCGHDYSMRPVKDAVDMYAKQIGAKVTHSGVHSDCWFIEV